MAVEERPEEDGRERSAAGLRLDGSPVEERFAAIVAVRRDRLLEHEEEEEAERSNRRLSFSSSCRNKSKEKSKVLQMQCRR